MKHRYQRTKGKSKGKFEVIGGRELAVRLPLPLVEVWGELQAEVERLTGEAGLQILRAIWEDEVQQRVGPRHRPDPAMGNRRWGQQPEYVVLGGQKISLERPRVRTRAGGSGEDRLRTLDAEVSPRGRDGAGWLRDREVEREPAFRPGHGGATPATLRAAAGRTQAGGVGDRWD